MTADYAEGFLRRSEGLQKPATVSLYRGMLERCVLPTLGRYQLGALTPSIVEGWVARVAAQSSVATARAAYRVLRTMLYRAVVDGYISKNPAQADSKRGGGVRLPEYHQREMAFLSADELHRLADAADERYRSAILLMGMVGLRIGEVAALRVEDLRMLGPLPGEDGPQGPHLYVRRPVSEVAGRLSEGTPKTEKGVRCVPLPPTVTDALAEHLNRHPSTGFVFTGPEGGQIRRTLFRSRVFVPALRKAGITRRVRVHDLRHSAARLLLTTLGGDPNTVAAILGHSDPGFTLRVYGHTDHSQAVVVMANLDAAYRKAQEDQGGTVVALGKGG